MKIGIVGLPMSGKTTLFRMLTEAEAGVGHLGKMQQRQTQVYDPRLELLEKDYDPKKVTQATIDFLDFPPIVKPGGAERKSCADLLAPAREASGLIVVVRNFENPSVPPVRGEIDAAGDLDDILDEIRFADLDIAQKRLEKLDHSIARKQGDEKKALQLEQEALKKVVAALEAGEDVAELSLSSAEAKAVKGFQFLSAKPRLIVENVDEVGKGGTLPGGFPVAVAIEQELSELDEESREIFAEEYGFSEPSKERVIREIYGRVGLISFLTAGEQEVRAWTIPDGSSAVDAAAAIHTDISRGFIRAEVVAWQDYVDDGGISGAKEKGHFRLEGKEYTVQDGDVVLFRFSV